MPAKPRRKHAARVARLKPARAVDAQPASTDFPAGSGARPVDPMSGGAPDPTTSASALTPAPMRPAPKVEALPAWPEDPAQAAEIAYQADVLQYPGYYQRAGLRWNLDRMSRIRGFRIYEEMLRDDMIVASLALLRAMLRSRPWFLSVDDEDEQGEARDFLDENLRRWLKGGVPLLLTNILSSQVFGYSFTEKVHGNVTWQGKAYWALTETKLRPPWSFMVNVDEWGNMLGLRQRIGPRFADLDPRKFVHHAWDGQWDPHYGRSGLYGCFEDYNAKRYIKRMWNIAMERAAVGLPWAQKQSALGPIEEAALANALKNLTTQGFLLTGANVKMEWIHPAADLKAFKDRIEQSDSAIARALLQPSHMGFAEQKSVGSKAQGATQRDTYHDIISSVGVEVEAVLNEQVLPELVYWNFGPDVTPPQFGFDDLDDGMKMAFATAWATLKAGNAIMWGEEDEKAARQLLRMTDYVVPDPVALDEPSVYYPGRGAPAQVGPDGKPLAVAPGQPAAQPQRPGLEPPAASPKDANGNPISPVARATKVVNVQGVEVEVPAGWGWLLKESDAGVQP